jgi:hypothetical protein
VLVVTGCESTADRVQIKAQSLQGDATDGAFLASEIVVGPTLMLVTHTGELKG